MAQALGAMRAELGRSRQLVRQRERDWRSQDISWEEGARGADAPVNINVQGSIGQVVTTHGQVTNIGSTVGGSVNWSSDLEAALEQLRWEIERSSDLSDGQRVEAVVAIDDVDEARSQHPERLGGRLHGLVSVLKALAPYAAAAPQWAATVEAFLRSQ